MTLCCGLVIGRVKQQYLERNLPYCHIICYRPHVDCSLNEGGSLGEKLASTYLSFGS
jgi:hypothetical protein